MKVLVTGGGGFLGSCIAHMLRERGDEVTALGRRAYPSLEQAGIRTVQADVRDAQAVDQACRGMDVVVHTAGVPGIAGKRRTFMEINVEGTRNVIDACRRHGVSRLVHTSSPSVVFGPGALCGVDESQPYPERHLADYPASKAAAERLVLAANGEGMSTVALRPHLIWGPGDPHLIPRLVARARGGQLRQVGDGTNLVDITFVDNAAAAHVLAVDKLAPDATCAGKAYFISQGEPVNLWAWLADILKTQGVHWQSRPVSFRTAHRVGIVLELAWRALRLRGEPRMTRFLAHQLSHSHYFDISAARRDLGYEPLVSTEEGMSRLVRERRAKNDGGRGLAGDVAPDPALSNAQST